MTFLRVSNGTEEVKNVTLSRFGITTTEPRLTDGVRRPGPVGIRGVLRQQGISMTRGVYSCIIREVAVTAFYIGIHLHKCWTARVLNCTVRKTLSHALLWENANAGEITGCRLQNSTTSPRSLHSGSCVVVLGNASTFKETLAFSVANNSFSILGTLDSRE